MWKRILRRVVMRPLYRRYKNDYLVASFREEFLAWRDQHPGGVLNDFFNPEPDYANRYVLYEHLLAYRELDKKAITYLEFGVAEGDSMNWWIEHNMHPESSFVGFDSFEGLPEQWDSKPKGSFSTGGSPPPVDDPRCHFEVGLFQNTLCDYLERVPAEGFRRPIVVHLDADLYSATLLVLFALIRYLGPGDTLVFDEFSSPLHEFKALSDFESATGIKYNLVAAVNNYRQIAIEIC